MTSRAQVAEDERGLGQLTLVGLDQSPFAALAQELAQLVLAVWRVPGLGCGRDPERLEDEVAHGVEQVDNWLGGQVEGAHGRCQQQRDRAGAGDGGTLGRQLAEHHVRDGDDRERHDRRQPEADNLRLLAEHRFEQVVEGGLADSAEAERGQRDAELAGRKVGVDVLDGVLRRSGPRPALAHEVRGLGGTQPGDGELGPDEEAVGGHEGDRDDETELHRLQRVELRRWRSVSM
jgi:hypothetical protein